MNKVIIREGGSAGGGAVYGLGFIGALIYFIQQSDTFWQVILAILKAIVWPALLLYKILPIIGL